MILLLETVSEIAGEDGSTALSSVELTEGEEPVMVELPPLGTTVDIAVPIVRVIEFELYGEETGAEIAPLEDPGNETD